MNVSKSPRNPISKTLRGIPRSGIRDFFDIVTQLDDVISMGVGEPDFVTPWHIRESSIYALERGRTSYTSNLGLLSLRKAVSAYVETTFGESYNPEKEILITVGVSEALDLAIRALVDPGDEVIYHEPCYVSYAPLITLAHGVPVVIETRAEDNFRMTPEALAAKITPRTKAIILNFPNNPTGGVLLREDLRGIARLAEEHDLILITDEIYAELTYDREHESLLREAGIRDRTIFLHGFSKAFAMTGFRVGYACAPPALTEAMMKIHQYTMLCAPILSQEAALEALKRPVEDIAEMKASYEARRNYLVAALNDLGIPCHLPGGAFYVFPDIRSFGLTSMDFAMGLIKAERVAAVPGTAFGKCGEGFLRCCYATALEDIKRAMDRLSRYLATLRS